MNPGCVNFIYCWLQAVACKMQGVQTWIKNVRFLVRLRFSSAPSIREIGGSVIFENAFIRLTISLPDGNTSAFLSKETGADFIADAAPFVFYRDQDSIRHEPDRASFVRRSSGEGLFRFFFEGGAIHIDIGCKAYPTHLTFDVEQIASTSGELPGDVQYVCIANLKLQGDDFSLMTGSILSDEYRITQFALNLYTHIIAKEPQRPSAPYSLEAWSLNAGQLYHIDWLEPWYASQVALFVGNKTEWLLLAREVEKTHNLPSPQIDSHWAKMHTDLNTSYLFVDVIPENVDEVIAYAKRGGFNYILARNWAKNYGHYELKDNFAIGLMSPEDGLREVSRKVHKAGLQFGLHVLAGVISQTDEYATARRDVLARKHDTTGDLLVFYGNYLPDIVQAEGRKLLLEMAQNFAFVYRLAKADMVYLDAVDGAGQVFLEYTEQKSKLAWHAYSFLADAYWRALPEGSNALFQAAAGNQNYEWHVLARQASTDYAAIGVEAYMDYFKIETFREKLEKAPLMQELGWIGLLAKTGRTVEYSFAGTTLEDIEYQLNRSAGHSLPIGLETTFAELQANALTGQILDRIGLYEKLRHADYFACRLDDTMLDRLKYPDTAFIERHNLTKVDYLLVHNDRSRVGFQRRVYIEHLVEGTPDTWQFNNPFGPQPLKIKITALPAIALVNDYTDAPNISLILPIDADNLECEKYPDDPNWGCTQVHSAGVLELTIENRTGNSVENGWVKLTKKLPDGNPLDLRNHKAVGLEIAGTSRGEVVSIMLAAGRALRQYQMGFDSSSMQYRQILIPATDEVFNHTEYIKNEYQKKSLRPFRYDKVDSVSLWVKNINLRVGESMVIRVKPIMALQQEYPLLIEPKITLNGGTLTFKDVTLVPTKNDAYGYWDYLELDADVYSVRDGNNQRLLERSISSVDVPVTVTGTNSIIYHHDGSNNALISIILEDVPQYWC